MNVRTKLFGSMALLVVFVTAVYFGTTQGYLGSRFHNYTTDRVAALFRTYYENNGRSWEGVERLELPGESEREQPERRGVVLLSPEGRVLFQKGQARSDSVIRGGTGSEIRIVVNGVYAGTVYTYGWESAETVQMKSYILNSMFVEGIRVAVLTGGIALLLGIWLIWRLTLPLRRLIPAIGRIAEGNFRIQIPVTAKDEYGKVADALNRMAERLMRAEEARKRLTADVAHELRTPLSIMQCHLENIQAGGRDVPPETLLPLQDEMIRLTKLVDDLHQLTLAEAGALPLERKPADLVSLMGRITDKLEAEAEAQHIEIFRRFPAEPIICDVDPNRITQVFYNLLSNALRYTSSGGAISILLEECHHEGKLYAAVAISDTGMGIAEEKLPFLFDRFYRVEEARSRHTGGMGLGLAIAKEFVEAHHGFIRVRSEAGRGTTFTVFLPCASD